MEINKTITFEVKSFRKLPNPYEKLGHGDKDPVTYMAICDVCNIPTDFPMNTNPRKQKLTTAVAKKVKASLLDFGAMDFYLLNRGILLSAESASFNNYNNMLTVTFRDDEVHGNVDGGHTYEIIKNCQNSIEPGTQFVKLEILTGVERIFTELAAARNTSVQVKDKSIAELENKFAIIKQGIDECEFSNHVYFQENDEGDVDVTDVLAVLNMFNLDRYPIDNMDAFPKASYTSTANCVKYYLSSFDQYGDGKDNPYVKMLPIMKTIFELYDHIEINMAHYYSQAVANGRYGAIKGVSAVKEGGDPFKARYSNHELAYQTPTGFIYPILGSMRALVEEASDGSGYRFVCDPVTILDEVGKELVGTTVERSRTLGGNPNAVGKDTGNWKTLYMTVAMRKMMMGNQ